MRRSSLKVKEVFVNLYSFTKQLLGGLILVITAFVLLLLSWHSQGFSSWYAVNIYPVFPATVGRLTGLFPFSVFEFLVLVIILLVIFWIVKTCILGRKQIFHFIRNILYLAGSIFLMYVLTAGINYNRESYADHVGITVNPSSVYELEELFFLLLNRANEIIPHITTDSTDHFVLSSDDTHYNAISAMKGLNDRHGGLNTHLSRAKPPFISIIMTHVRVGGFFSPWTLEANYNNMNLAQSMPYTITHELAHLAGYMREDEANFIAYLACRDSENADFQYSAVYTALNYTLIALIRAVGRKQVSELYQMLPEQIIRDRENEYNFWNKYDGKVAEVSSKVNDTYLKANRQEDGVRSYGRMVDLLLAYYKEKGLI